MRIVTFTLFQFIKVYQRNINLITIKQWANNDIKTV